MLERPTWISVTPWGWSMPRPKSTPSSGSPESDIELASVHAPAIRAGRRGGSLLLAFVRASATLCWALGCLVPALNGEAAAGEDRLDTPPAKARRMELVRLVRQDCGSCHGMTLKGGLGPPLTPEALKDKPLDSLVATVLSGRPGTPMPPWDRFLDEDEARWIVRELQRGFPAE
jgi:cytochrome c55X